MSGDLISYEKVSIQKNNLFLSLIYLEIFSSGQYLTN